MPWTCSKCGCEAGMMGCSNPNCGKEIVMNKRDELIKELQEYLNDDHEAGRIADFILNDRKRIVEPLVRHRAFDNMDKNAPLIALDIAIGAINETLKLSGELL